MLRAQVGQRIPAGIEDHKHGTDMMLRRDGQKAVDAFLKTCGILLPEQVVEKDPHRVHAHRLCPGEFGIDLGRVEGCLLPHFQLVDRRLGNVITANQPRLLRVPGVRFLLRPARGLRPCYSSAQADHDQY